MPKPKGEQFSFADETPEIKRPQKDHPAQRLLTWLSRWNRDTITVRQLRVWGPRCFRDPKEAINAAQILAANGWLKPIKPHWPGTFAWEIVRKNIVHPTIDM